MFETVESAVRYWEKTTPGAPAWWFVEDSVLKCITWSDVGKVVTHATTELKDLSIEPGDRVVSLLPNCLAWMAVDMACNA